ncbi:MAG: hypothetical protein ACTSW1_10130 [Candidatus Hodarchaeales archaeon]
MFEQEEIADLKEGFKVEKNGVKFDSLAGFIIEYCYANPKRITVTSCFESLQGDVKKISRNMVKSRLDKLRKVGFLGSTKEAVDNDRARERTVYYLTGEKPEVREPSRKKGKSKEGRPSTFPYIEVSKSSRAECRECGTKILKGTLRIVKPKWEEIEVKGNRQWVVISQYYHMDCFNDPKYPREEIIEYSKNEKKSISQQDLELKQ